MQSSPRGRSGASAGAMDERIGAPTVTPPARPWYARLLELVEDFRRREDRLALALSLLIGALVGLTVVAFILLTGRLAAHMYPPGGEAAWRRIVVPTLGALATGYLLYRFFPNARGSGIPQTRAAIFVEDGRISLRTVLGKFLCCSASLASGIALGREGPSVQIGAGMSSVIGRRLGLSAQQVRWLLPVGASAALAAAFNTPIAAILFSLEEIMGDMHAPILGSVVLSSTTSWMVLHLVLGDEPLFHVAPYHLIAPSELGIYAVLGIIGGFGSVAFVRMLLGLRRAFARLPEWTVWCQPVVGGLCVGAFGYFVPQVLGVGYEQVDHALSGDIVLRLLVLLAVLKIVATAVCYASGNAGGIFGPTMFIGAMLGGAVGQIAHGLLPATTASPGAYALVGMGTAFAGIIRTPLTSVIMIFEVTRNYAIIVPLMISNLLAFYISQKFQREPIYEALSRQDGLHLPAGDVRGMSRQLRVSAAMRPATSVLSADLPAADARRRVGEAAVGSWPVVDAGGLVGMLRAADLIAAVENGHASAPIRELVDAGEAADDGMWYVHRDHPLGLALARMGAAHHTVLPVVSRKNARVLLGTVTLPDILCAYGVERVDEVPGVREATEANTAE
ncbi:MAG TPA: chloride channel protein [Gemmatimonadaceae bacterium]|nr:chloride channel protein [Gemmatimonadaceae bacterium]